MPVDSQKLCRPFVQIKTPVRRLKEERTGGYWLDCAVTSLARAGKL
jgi:hypothetical protein